jgi:hypothetical protein
MGIHMHPTDLSKQNVKIVKSAIDGIQKININVSTGLLI